MRAFVDVNIFCWCANYLVQLQNIQKVYMIVCMCTCLDLYIDHLHNIIINGNILYVNYLCFKLYPAL